MRIQKRGNTYIWTCSGCDSSGLADNMNRAQHELTVHYQHAHLYSVERVEECVTLIMQAFPGSVEHERQNVR